MDWLRSGGYHARRESLRAGSASNASATHRVVRLLQSLLINPIVNVGIPRDQQIGSTTDVIASRRWTLRVIALQAIKLCLIAAVVVEILVPWLSPSLAVPDINASWPMNPTIIAQQDTPTTTAWNSILLIADPQLTDAYSSTPDLGGWLQPLLTLMSDVYMKRVVKTLGPPARSYDTNHPTTIVDPTVAPFAHTGVVFLGDLFDGGRYIPVTRAPQGDVAAAFYSSPRGDISGEWRKELSRFWNIFGSLIPTEKRNRAPTSYLSNKAIEPEDISSPGWFRSVVGNHDVDIGTVSAQLYDRFTAFFGTSNWHVKLSDRVVLVGINSVSFVDYTGIAKFTDITSQLRDVATQYFNLKQQNKEASVTNSPEMAKLEARYRGLYEELEAHIETSDSVLQETLNFLAHPAWDLNAAVILVSHIPLYREDGTECSSVRQFNTFELQKDTHAKRDNGDSIMTNREITEVDNISGNHGYFHVRDDDHDKNDDDNNNDKNKDELRKGESNLEDFPHIVDSEEDGEVKTSTDDKINIASDKVDSSNKAKNIGHQDTLVFSHKMDGLQFDRHFGDIRQGRGKGYQNELTKPSSDLIVSLVGNPLLTTLDSVNRRYQTFVNDNTKKESGSATAKNSILFSLSGDDHDFCSVFHKNYGFTEFTLPTLSFLQGTRHPGLARIITQRIDGDGIASDVLVMLVVGQAYDWFWWIFHVYCILGLFLIVWIVPTVLWPLVGLELLYTRVIELFFQATRLKTGFPLLYRVVMIPRFILAAILYALSSSASIGGVNNGGWQRIREDDSVGEHYGAQDQWSSNSPRNGDSAWTGVRGPIQRRGTRQSSTVGNSLPMPVQQRAVQIGFIQRVVVLTMVVLSGGGIWIFVLMVQLHVL